MTKSKDKEGSQSDEIEEKVKEVLIVDTLQGKFHLCITFLGIARPQSQFQHSCV
jgi:hypothetical protein